MTDLEFVTLVSYRLEQMPQGVTFPADMVFSIRDTALGRLAEKVAAEPDSYTVLQRAYPLVLASGEISLLNQNPSLLFSSAAKKNWHVTMADVRFPIVHIPNRRDFLNLPPTPDYYFYNLLNGVLAVRNYANEIPAETALILYGNYVPLITDNVFSTTGELREPLIDEAVSILMPPKPTPS